MKFLALITFSTFLLSSCGSSSSESPTDNIQSAPLPVVDIEPHEVGTLQTNIIHDDISREFILYVPDSYNRNFSYLIFMAMEAVLTAK